MWILQADRFIHIPVYVSLFMTVYASGQCPPFEGCFCVTGIVSCSGLTEFPTSFPEDATTITLSHVDVEEIPSGAFTSLPALHSVEIYGGNISRIRYRAFNGLSDFDRICLGNINIGKIENEAFSDLSDFGTLSIYRSTIDVIESKAFSRIFALDTLRIFSSNITAVQHESFYMLEEAMQFSFFTNNVQIIEGSSFAMLQNLGSFEMFQNDIRSLTSETIEYIVKHAVDVSLYSNTFSCDCQLEYLLQHKGLTKHLYSNWCKDIETGQKYDLANLSLASLSCDDKLTKATDSLQSELPVTENSQAAETHLFVEVVGISNDEQKINDSEPQNTVTDLSTSGTPKVVSTKNKADNDENIKESSDIYKILPSSGGQAIQGENKAKQTTRDENIVSVKNDHQILQQNNDHQILQQNNNKNKSLDEIKTPRQDKVDGDLTELLPVIEYETRTHPNSRTRIHAIEKPTSDLTGMPNYEIQNDQNVAYPVEDKTREKMSQMTSTAETDQTTETVRKENSDSIDFSNQLIGARLKEIAVRVVGITQTTEIAATRNLLASENNDANNFLPDHTFMFLSLLLVLTA